MGRGRRTRRSRCRSCRSGLQRRLSRAQGRRRLRHRSAVQISDRLGRLTARPTETLQTHGHTKNFVLGFHAPTPPPLSLGPELLPPLPPGTPAPSRPQPLAPPAAPSSSAPYAPGAHSLHCVQFASPSS